MRKRARDVALLWLVQVSWRGAQTCMRRPTFHADLSATKNVTFCCNRTLSFDADPANAPIKALCTFSLPGHWIMLIHEPVNAYGYHGDEANGA